MFQEKQRMTDQLEDSSLQLKDEMELYREVVDQLWLHRHQFHKEKEAMQEVSSAPSAISSNQQASHVPVRTRTGVSPSLCDAGDAVSMVMVPPCDGVSW